MFVRDHFYHVYNSYIMHRGPCVVSVRIYILSKINHVYIRMILVLYYIFLGFILKFIYIQIF